MPELRLPPLSLVLLVAGFGLLGAPFIMKSPAEETAVRPLPQPATSEPAPAQPAASIADTEPAPTAAGDAAPALPWNEQTVRRGDNLSLIFKRAGHNTRDVYEVVSGAADGKSLERIYPGQSIAFQSDDSGELVAVKHVRSRLETVIYRRTENGFDSEVTTRTPQSRVAWASGTIDSSLFLAGQEAGLSQNTIMELANIFGGVIDFVLDPRKGDTLHLIYEDLYLDGEKFQDGDIIAASFTNRGKTFNAYRYTDSNGEVGYFNEDGVSMRKAFLLAPVDFTRISSNFNLRRLHPIYKTTRPHRGTDYAASRGTPVFAAGDGRVVKAGYNKSNGNYVFIKHGEQYMTKYLHLHKRKVKAGQRVSQSQVIGTVGSTGAATGPHLHYEFLVNGVHRNPRTIHKKLPKAKSLPAQELARFKQAINESSLQLAALRSDNRLAMSEPGQAEVAHN
ncbi:MAG: peptidoglycan DD-metalloendopeptidase family protein [Thiohalobacterales bacterium]|nr:peptidoglycan DD-metalloendopeptidase family protein [Thiohalobacterales bacterium]